MKPKDYGNLFRMVWNVPPIIPKVYQPRPIVGESEEYRQLIKMATDHMKNESEFLNQHKATNKSMKPLLS